jgi:predicted lipoprotein
MSAVATSQPARTRRISPRLVGAIVCALVLVALALDTTTRSDKAPRVTGRVAFDPAAYGSKTYPKVVSEVEKRAIPVTDLVPALEKDADAAGEQHGVRQGSSPYNFAVTGEGVAGNAEGGLLPVKVKGLEDANVALQIGPALNGTALRDVVGFITFNQFINQVDYADAATALNNQVKAKVLKGIDPASLEGKTVRFTGAFTLLVPNAITVTPVGLEAS